MRFCVCKGRFLCSFSTSWRQTLPILKVRLKMRFSLHISRYGLKSDMKMALWRCKVLKPVFGRKNKISNLSQFVFILSQISFWIFKQNEKSFPIISKILKNKSTLHTKGACKGPINHFYQIEQCKLENFLENEETTNKWNLEPK